MSPNPFILVSPASRGLSLALTRHFLRTTDLPVYATHRSDSQSAMKEHILEPLPGVDPKRLNLLHLDLTSEHSISSAAEALSQTLRPGSYIHTAFFTGGLLFPEKQPLDLDADKLSSVFQINVISHLLLIKHFSRFLPSAQKPKVETPAKWVHVSARVGSISDNARGGWYSYRSSKAALNQVVKTFDLHLQMNKNQAICVGVHPGTVKTELSRGFWESADGKGVFEPEESARRLAGVVDNLGTEHRGRVWDWEGKQVPW
ncbi:putative NAD-P-binding protein [Lyophyllum shimeji]|uniref:NAD-P-binding protein n=1 Tax=Lyophyllum shimeji TaxID=47721 RepID=A0A9P3PDN1_LYOSH|nr:putative NAD-P-binding protein [Lyophyllum shimeji]